MSKEKGIETSLCLLNGIVEEENISENFSELISKHPEVVSILPKLLGFREQNVKILEHSNSSVLITKNILFKKSLLILLKKFLHSLNLSIKQVYCLC